MAPEVRDLMVLPYEQWIIWPNWQTWRWARKYPEEAIVLLRFRDIENRHHHGDGIPRGPQGQTP